MRPARVLVLFSRSLMMLGILRWLMDQESIDAEGRDREASGVRESVVRFGPDVIIVDEDDIDVNGILTTTELMQYCPEAKIVRIDPSSNLIRIVQQQEVAVAGVEDLLRLITSG